MATKFNPYFMTPNFYKALLLCFFFGSFYTTYGQVNNHKADSLKATTDTDDTPKKSSFKISVDYLSNDVFMGRTDTTKTPLITPGIKYTFKSGIFFSGTLDYLPNRKTSKLDGGNFAAGYDFDITDDLSGGVSFTKLFFSKTSTQVSSAINSTLNGNLDYNIADIVTVSVSLDYNINKQGVNNDFVFNPGLSHDFTAESVFGNKDILLISPMVTLNTGTQNFYDGYLVRKNLKNAKRNAAETKLFDSYTIDLSEFTLLDYEFSMPIEYKSGPFIFHVTPTYAIAENQFQSAAVQKLLGLSGKPSVFYIEVGVALKF